MEALGFRNRTFQGRLMKLSMLLESFSPNGEFYHAGPNFEKFSLEGFGRGENNHLLGHGLYFINSVPIAKGYAKYSTDPFLYTVRFNAPAGAFYNNRTLPTPEQEVAYNKIATELGFDHYRSVKLNHSNMKYGRGLPGAVFAKMGTQAGGKFLTSCGVVGQIEEVDAGVYEVAVYDPSIIQIIDKQPLEGLGKPKEEPNPELDAWWEEMMNQKPEDQQ